MPEGHHIHRLARDLTGRYGALSPRVTSPQGRFADSAALLDGTTMVGAWAVGKNLFVGFEGERVVHIHLGLIGKLRWYPWPGGPGQVRRRIATPEQGAYDLTGPQVCRLLTPAEAAEVAAQSGPDPLDPAADADKAWIRVQRASRPIAALLMDQSMFAGVGNIYRAEVLYRARLHPHTEGRKVTRRTFDRIWSDLVELMPLGVRDDRINTVRPEHTPEAMGREPRVDRHGGEVYVYRRHDQPCLVCGRRVKKEDLAGRNLYWCSTCQRRRS